MSSPNVGNVCDAVAYRYTFFARNLEAEGGRNERLDERDLRRVLQDAVAHLHRWLGLRAPTTDFQLSNGGGRAILYPGTGGANWLLRRPGEKDGYVCAREVASDALLIQVACTRRGKADKNTWNELRAGSEPGD